MLIAGCGTGRYVAEAAKSFSRANILAVDLSRSSLSYAMRKAGELGIANATFAQADILKMGSAGRSFDVIEASGVLHHLGDPFAGWRSLLAALRPRGCMCVGLYSELARRDIMAVQNYISSHGYERMAADIRRCRQDLMTFQPGTPQRNMGVVADFYTLSECRDLLFHVQEHRHNIPQLAAFIRDHALEFIGFELDPALARQYRQRFPQDSTMTNLDLWHQFETERPDSFIGMYRFWIQKPGG